MKQLTISILMILLCLSPKGQSQSLWNPIDSLDQIYAEGKKPLFLYFYADWCKVCKLQEQSILEDSSLLGQLKNEWIAAKLDGESTAELSFLGRKYQGADQRKYHELVDYLSGENRKISFPMIVLFDDHLNLIYRSEGMLDKKSLTQLFEQIKTKSNKN